MFKVSTASVKNYVLTFRIIITYIDAYHELNMIKKNRD
jgi:hypothetical protein